MSRNHDSTGASPDLRNLVRAASQLQEQVRSAVQRLERSTNTAACEDTELQGTSQGRQGGETAEWTSAGWTPITGTSTVTIAAVPARMNYSNATATAGHFSGEL